VIIKELKISNASDTENFINQTQKSLKCEDEKLADEEYYKCAIKALKEAIDENEKVKNSFWSFIGLLTFKF